MNQMDDNGVKRFKDKQEIFEEGRKMKQKQEEDAVKIEAIRGKKITKMAHTGGEQKFQTQLGSKKFIP